MMRRQKGIINQPHPVKLSIQPQHLLPRLGNLQKHIILILPLLYTYHARARDILSRTQLSCQRRRNGQTLPVQHNDCLPIVEFQELRRELHACVLACWSRFFPFPESTVDVSAPRAEGGEVLEEWRREFGVDEFVAAVCAGLADNLGLLVL